MVAMKSVLGSISWVSVSMLMSVEEVSCVKVTTGGSVERDTGAIVEKSRIDIIEKIKRGKRPVLCFFLVIWFTYYRTGTASVLKYVSISVSVGYRGGGEISERVFLSSPVLTDTDHIEDIDHTVIVCVGFRHPVRRGGGLAPVLTH